MRKIFAFVSTYFRNEGADVEAPNSQLKGQIAGASDRRACRAHELRSARLDASHRVILLFTQNER